MKRIIITMLAGSYKKLSDIVCPFLKKYASKCRADFHCIDNIKHKDRPVLDKLSIIDFFPEYDRLLFIDGDAIVRPDCPNLFSLVPKGSFAAYDEASQLWTSSDIRSRISDVDALVNEWKLPAVNYAKVQDWSLPPRFPNGVLLTPNELTPYYNSGVFLMGKEHAVIFEKPKLEPLPMPNIPCVEQVYMNWSIKHHEIKMYHMPVCFNQMPHNRWRDYQRTSFILHYAGISGVDSKLDAIKFDMFAWEKLGYL